MTNPPYKIPSIHQINRWPWNGLRVASLFAGGGGSSTGWRWAGFKVVYANEFMPYAADVYQANHPRVKVDRRDIKLVQPEDIGEVDILDGSPPCFPANTLIQTIDGLVPIKNLEVGQKVLTHKGNYLPIIQKMVKDYLGKMVKIKTNYGRSGFSCTDDHPIYCMTRNWSNTKSYNPAKFIKAKDLRIGDLILEPFSYQKIKLKIPDVIKKYQTNFKNGTFKVNFFKTECEINWKTNLMGWLLGFYLAEGHRRGKNPDIKNGPCRREVIYSIADKEVKMLVKKLVDAGFNPTVTKHGDGCSRISVSSIDFWCLCSVMGDRASYKFVPEAFHSMPVEWQLKFVDGYYSGDGNFNKKHTLRKATTVSIGIAVGIARMTARTQKQVASIHQSHWAGDSVIMGRKVKIKDTFVVSYYLPSKRTRMGMTNCDGAWLPISEIDSKKESLKVFNIEVYRDNSYVAAGFAVHNCQGFSIANQNRLKNKPKTYENGITQINENMFPEYIRILRGLKPKVFVAENVRGLTIGGGKKVFGSFEMDMFVNQDDMILHALMNSGYIVRWQILNAADYGTPQSRPRVFIIGARKDLNMEPVFPVKQGFQYSVLDALPHLAGDDIHFSDQAGHGTSPVINNDRPLPCISKRGHKDSGCKTFIRQGQKDNFRNLGMEYDLNKSLPTVLSGVGGGKDQFGISIGYGMGYKKSSNFPRNVQKPLHEPMATIAKMPGCAGGSNTTVTDGENTRKFTIAELKRLGGFPDDYDLTPAKSYSRSWEVIGNSVAPPQMKAIASCLYHQIFRKL